MTSYSERLWLQRYDEHVTPDIALPDFTLLDFFEKGSNANPERAAFHFLGTTCKNGVCPHF